MTYADMKEAERYAKEFIRAVRRFELEDSLNMKEHRYASPGRERQDISSMPLESGLVRHWSIILSRSLSKMRSSSYGR